MENIRNAIITPPSKKLVRTYSVNGKYKKHDHHPQQKARQDLQCEWEMKETPSPPAESSSRPAVWMENIRNTIITPSRKIVRTCSVNGKYKKHDHHPQQKARQDLQCEWKI
jgi:hypothetical protein